jgi:hypothetical protein
MKLRHPKFDHFATASNGEGEIAKKEIQKQNPPEKVSS